MHINILKINNNSFVKKKKKMMSSPYSPDYRLRYPQIEDF